MRRRAAAALPLLLFALPLCAQDSGARLSVTVGGGQTTFHIGERIPLTLTITGSVKDHVNGASYDRSGRLGIDTYEVTPSEGWADPLKEFYSVGGFMGGGLFSVDTLAKPFTITRDLNEWVRFDQPGDYSIVVLSARVASGKSSGYDGDSITLRSPAFKLHIIPATPAWQAATLQRIVETLSKPHRSEHDDPARTNALADLRYLASAASIPVLASYLREDEINPMWQAILGLRGLPPSLIDTAVAAMQGLVDDPCFPLYPEFLENLSALQTINAAPASTHSWEMPPARVAALALARKDDKARAVTAHTLLSATNPPLSPGDRAAVASVLGTSFLDLPADQQVQALQSSWKLLRSPSMLPTLRRLASPNSSAAPPRFGQPGDLRALALKRWYELDPEGAHREILSQIGSPAPTLSADNLWFLPSEPLTQFESIWAEALTNGNSSYETELAGLLARFGSGVSVAQVIARLQASVTHESCAPQAAELAYVLRFAPDSAGPLLDLAANVHRRDENNCGAMLFTSVTHYASGPVLTQAAIAALKSTKAEVVADALNYLRRYCDESCRDPLLEHYLQWADHRRSQPAEAEDRSDNLYSDQFVGKRFLEALLANQGWIPDKALRNTVLRACPSPKLCRTAAELSSESHNVSIEQSDHKPVYQVGSFVSPTLALLEAKLDQFPKDTTFTLTHAYSIDQGDEDSLEATLPSLFSKHGMKLVPATEK